MEMNTRIQVEHTVTELVTGLDLVREQILIALGEPLSLTQDEVRLQGHAIECRINAEDVARGFLPTPGLVTAYREPSGPGVRVDSGVGAGNEVSGAYDPMIAKLIVHGVDREHARRRMLRALGEFVIEGPKTLIGFHQALLSSECFIAGETCHGLVESRRARGARGRARQPTNGYQAARALGGIRSTGRAWWKSTGAASRCASRSPSRRGASLARRRHERERAGGGGRRQRGRLADAGHGALRCRHRGRARRGGTRDLHRRGDEDGERGESTPRRYREWSRRRSRRARGNGPDHLPDHR